MTEQEQIEKLTERLQKAVEVFKTQKADIDRLQTERDESQAENEKLRVKLKEFEERINANSENEATMMQQAEELTRVESEFASYKSTVQEVEKAKSKLEAELTTLKSEMSSVKEKLKENVLNIINNIG